MKIWSFFYGAYMNLKVLKSLNVIPEKYEVAKLNGFDISIKPRANVLPSSQQCVYGIIAKISHDELNRLYAPNALGEMYLPQAVLVETLDGKWVSVICYIVPVMEPKEPTYDYVDKIITPAKELNFPEWYIKRLEDFKTQ